MWTKSGMHRIKSGSGSRAMIKLRNWIGGTESKLVSNVPQIMLVPFQPKETTWTRNFEIYMYIHEN